MPGVSRAPAGQSAGEHARCSGCVQGRIPHARLCHPLRVMWGSLHIEPLRSTQARVGVLVASAADPDTLEGLFQERCRDLVAQIRTMGFEPHVWVDMINDLGVTLAAKRILAANMPLAATRWLIDQGRPELTMEHEIIEMRWADLFDDDERSEARRRLEIPR